MKSSATHLLLIESDPADAKVIKDALHDDSAAFVVEWVKSLAEALEYLAKNPIEVVLLDLALPDGKGLGAFDKVIAAAPDALILVLSSASDDELRRAAMERGAHDYFAKGHIDAHWLPRALNYILERKESRSALSESEERFQVMSDASPLGIFLSDAQGDCIYTNAAYHTISGQTLDETLGTNWTEAIHPDDRQQAVKEWHAAVNKREPFLAEVRFVRSDNTMVWTRLNAAAINSKANKKAQGYVQIVEDISDRKAIETILRVSEDALFDQQERAQVTLNSIGDAVLTTNLAGKISYLNRTAETMTGWSLKEALGLPLEDVFKVIDADSRQPPPNPVRRALKANKTIKLPSNCLLVRRDGSEIPIEDSIAPIRNRLGAISGAVIVFHDVSDARAMAKKILHMAQHDVLTGLANRTLLTERLTRALGLAKRKQKKIGLLFIDIDNFKNINDSRGHAVGDRLLQIIARRLESVVRVTDTVCRQGGDEFVVLLTEIEHSEDAAHVADKMIAAFAAPQQIHEQPIAVTLSIGISLYPNDGSNVDALFQRADSAMYRAKMCGRNNYQFYSSGVDTPLIAAADSAPRPQANTSS
ncbi:response regulator receiver modulated diguanylate cyclase/phosphodiesterase with PAS/PAC sensor(s) [Cellvibrio sp. BR]|uniref:GGDEF domain-containing response regulator n=1 Tax=Cellvibrio sp. BR TaxID=1134474 RepID=UPI0002600E48|nr:GGDEF domain-containing response regulator [Cellvibrio sp. BR]EIK44561.1 response regulator receiver modulated diguanylate cyclase/phosphodiesterase with PAS/PAC sensor(s) [Cellvibrio sp. BR]